MPVSEEALPSVIPATQKKCPIGGYHLSKLGGGRGESQKEGCIAVRREFTLLAQSCPWEPFWQKWKCGSKQTSAPSVFCFRFPGGVRAQVITTATMWQIMGKSPLFCFQNCVILANEFLKIGFFKGVLLCWLDDGVSWEGRGNDLCRRLVCLTN